MRIPNNSLSKVIADAQLNSPKVSPKKTPDVNPQRPTTSSASPHLLAPLLDGNKFLSMQDIATNKRPADVSDDEESHSASKRRSIDAPILHHEAQPNIEENSETSLSDSDSEFAHLKTHDVGNLKALSEFPLRENNASIFTVLMDQLVILDVRNKGEFSGLFSCGASTCSILTAHTVDKSGKVTQIALGHITANELSPNATEKSISTSESLINLLTRNQPEGVHHISIIGGDSDLAEELHEQLLGVQMMHGERVKLSFVDANLDESRIDNVVICSANIHCYYENTAESQSSEFDNLEEVLSEEQLNSYEGINASNNKTKVYFAIGHDMYRISFNDMHDSNFSVAKVKHLSNAIIE